LIPLIYSTGPDGATYDRKITPSDYTPSRTGGYLELEGSMSPPSLLSITTLTPLPGALTASGSTDARNNITNHDLLKK